MMKADRKLVQLIAVGPLWYRKQNDRNSSKKKETKDNKNMSSVKKVYI